MQDTQAKILGPGLCKQVRVQVEHFMLTFIKPTFVTFLVRFSMRMCAISLNLIMINSFLNKLQIQINTTDFVNNNSHLSGADWHPDKVVCVTGGHFGTL